MLTPTIDAAGPIIRSRPVTGDNNLDMTPMIDVTFLLLIFFLVTSSPDVRAALDLPKAEHGSGISKRTALTVSVAAGDDGSGVVVYLADVKSGEPLPSNRTAQEEAVRRATEEALGRGVDRVLIQAERRVRFRDVERLVRAATIPGVSVHLAVTESD
jgi:biopolymer transport protein ExbD